MDDRRFDQIARTLANVVSRRGMFGGLLASVLTSVPRVAAAKSCKKDKDCPVPGNPCEAAVCRNKQCKKTTAPDGTVCATEMVCIAGKCRAALECATAVDCPAPANLCKRNICDDGLCILQNKGNGTVCGDDGACRNGVCIGPGPAQCTRDSQCQPGSDPCLTAVCQNKTCVQKKTANGTVCPGGECQNGTCCTRVCGNQCCSGSETCTSGVCCATAKACGNTCCAASDQCVAGGCCAPANTCAAACCTANQRCLGGACCPVTRACGQVCCPDGQTCAGGACVVVVSPSNMQGWGFYNENTEQQLADTFVTGPGDPPLGTGSAELAITNDANGVRTEILRASIFNGVAIKDFTTLQFSDYSSQENRTASLQMNVDYDPDDDITGFQGRLVYDPAIGKTVAANTWNTWNALTDQGKCWYFSRDYKGTRLCSNVGANTRCTLADVLGYYPKMRIQPDNLAAIGLRIGESGPTPLTVDIDDLEIAVSGAAATIYDFEPIALLNAAAKRRKQRRKRAR